MNGAEPSDAVHSVASVDLDQGFDGLPSYSWAGRNKKGRKPPPPSSRARPTTRAATTASRTQAAKEAAARKKANADYDKIKTQNAEFAANLRQFLQTERANAFKNASDPEIAAAQAEKDAADKLIKDLDTSQTQQSLKQTQLLLYVQEEVTLQKKMYNIFASEMRFTPFIYYYDTLG